MKKQTFLCDNCKNQQIGEIDNNGRDIFPYDIGWIYLHTINFKVNKSKVKVKNEKHFCCSECFTAYTRRILHNEIDKNKEDEKEEL